MEESTASVEVTVPPKVNIPDPPETVIFLFTGTENELGILNSVSSDNFRSELPY